MDKIDNPRLVQAMIRYCKYQQRCESEVREKLHLTRASPEETEAITAFLKRENLFNDQRYAEAVVAGKHNQLDWGKSKIIHFLHQKNIDPETIQAAIQAKIDDNEYNQRLIKIAEKKIETLKSDPKDIIKRKVYIYLTGKGYAYHTIDQLIGEQFK
ncbi:MAG: regulatory protein RecX [Chitinophagia bacterium]|nr:regulatory protein RecX [Chitinophagia bacterium]